MKVYVGCIECGTLHIPAPMDGSGYLLTQHYYGTAEELHTYARNYGAVCRNYGQIVRNVRNDNEAGSKLEGYTLDMAREDFALHAVDDLYDHAAMQSYEHAVGTAARLLRSITEIVAEFNTFNTTMTTSKAEAQANLRGMIESYTVQQQRREKHAARRAANQLPPAAPNRVADLVRIAEEFAPMLLEITRRVNLYQHQRDVAQFHRHISLGDLIALVNGIQPGYRLIEHALVDGYVVGEENEARFSYVTTFRDSKRVIYTVEHTQALPLRRGADGKISQEFSNRDLDGLLDVTTRQGR